MKPQEEIEQLAEQYTQDGIYLSDSEKQQTEIAYMIGYKQCQQDMIEKYTEQDMIKFAFDTYYQEVMAKKYTEEDIREAIDMARMLSHVSCLEDGEHRLKYSNTEEDIINSLNKQD
jgi:hypothetical protein